MFDNSKAVISQTVTDNDHPMGYLMDASSSYSFTSKLPPTLETPGEHENDYVQFAYGSLSWQSKTLDGGARCEVGGWDSKGGPTCSDEPLSTAVCDSYMLGDSH